MTTTEATRAMSEIDLNGPAHDVAAAPKPKRTGLKPGPKALFAVPAPRWFVRRTINRMIPTGAFSGPDTARVGVTPPPPNPPSAPRASDTEGSAGDKWNADVHRPVTEAVAETQTPAQVAALQRRQMQFTLLVPGVEELEAAAKAEGREVTRKEAARAGYVRNEDMPNPEELIYADQGGFNAWIDQAQQDADTQEAEAIAQGMPDATTVSEKRMRFVLDNSAINQGKHNVTWMRPRKAKFALAYKLQYGNDRDDTSRPGLLRCEFRVENVPSPLDVNQMLTEQYIGHCDITSDAAAAAAEAEEAEEAAGLGPASPASPAYDSDTEDATRPTGEVVEGESQGIAILDLTETGTDVTSLLSEDCATSFLRTDNDRTRVVTMDVLAADDGDGFPAVDDDGKPSWERTRYKVHLMTLAWNIEYRWRDIERERQRSLGTAPELVFKNRFLDSEGNLKKEEFEAAQKAAAELVLEAFGKGQICAGLVHGSWNRHYKIQQTLQKIEGHGGDDRTVLKDEVEYFKAVMARRGGFDSVRTDKPFCDSFGSALFPLFQSYRDELATNAELAYDAAFMGRYLEVSSLLLPFVQLDLELSPSQRGDQTFVNLYNDVAGVVGEPGITFDSALAPAELDLSDQADAADEAAEAAEAAGLVQQPEEEVPDED